jgi:hypothetical protein
VGIEDAIVPTTGRCDDRHPEDSSARAHKRTKITAATVDHLQQRPKKMAEPKLEGSVKRTSWSRPTDQAEHILRERHRRDDMTVKYSILESLLPAGSKVSIFTKTLNPDNLRKMTKMHINSHVVM